MDLGAMACPACGCPHWTGLVGWVPGPHGDDIECAECGLWIWDGQILATGDQPTPEQVARDAAAIGAQKRRGSGPAKLPLYVAPEDRLLALALIDARTMVRPTSVTVRFNRGAARRWQPGVR